MISLILPLLPLVLYLAIFPFIHAGTTSVAAHLYPLLPLALVSFKVLFPKSHSSSSIPNRLVSLFIIAFFTTLSVSTYYSQSVIDSWEIWGRWLATLSLIFLWPLIHRKHFVFLISNLVIFVGTLLSLASLILALLGYTPPASDSYTFLSLVSGHNQLSNYLIISLPLSLSLYLQAPEKYKYLRIPLIIMFLALLLTFARGAWVKMLLFPLIYLSLNHTNSTFSRRLLSVFVIASLVLTVLLLINFKKETLPFNPTSQRSLNNLSTQPLNLLRRLDYFQVAVNRWKSHPLVGTGLGTYEFNGELLGYTIYAHNYLLQLLSETGLISTVLFIVIMFHFYLKLFRQAKHSPHPIYKAIFISLILSFFYSLIDFGWNYWLIFLTVLSLLLSSTSNVEESVTHKDTSFFRRLSFVVILLQLLFIILYFAVGATSFYYHNHALALSSTDSRKAGELFDLSLKLYPFNRDAYRHSINFFDQHDRQHTAAIINRWSRLDMGNGELYQYLSVRSFAQDDVSSALKYLHRAISSPLRPTINFPFIFNVLSKAKDQSRQDLFDSVGIIRTLDTKFNGTFLSNFYYQNYLDTYYFIESLTTSPYFAQLNPSDQSLINYHAALGEIYRDNNDWKKISRYCQQVIQVDNINPACSDLVVISDLILNEPNLDKLNRQLSLLGSADTSNLRQRDLNQHLIALLYQEKALVYQKLGDNQSEIEARQIAISTYPQLASLQLNLIRRYRELGEEEKSMELLNKCVDRFGSICLQWYSNFLNRSLN